MAKSISSELILNTSKVKIIKAKTPIHKEYSRMFECAPIKRKKGDLIFIQQYKIGIYNG